MILGMITRRTLLGAVAALGFVKSSRATEQQLYPSQALVDSLGVCTHLSYSNTTYARGFDEIVYPYLVESGIRHVRDGVLTGKGVSDHHPYYLRARKLVTAGIRFSCVCPDETFAGGPTDLTKLADVYDWFSHGIDYFEGANEPNYSKNPNWPQLSAEGQRRLYAAVKGDERLRRIPVLGPSYWGPSGRPAGDLSDVMDYGNIHPYPGGRNPETGKEGSLEFYLKGAQLNCDTKPVVATETGYHSALESKRAHPPISEQLIARYLPRLVLFSLMKGVKRSYVYELVDTHYRGLSDQESNFGLIRYNGERKPAYYALKNLVAIFSDSGPPIRLAPLSISIESDIQNLFWMMFERSDRQYLVAVWIGKNGWDAEQKVVLPETVSRVSLRFSDHVKIESITKFDDQGAINVVPSSLSGTEIPVQVSDCLAVVRLKRVS
jgi:hypothetical protein